MRIIFMFPKSTVESGRSLGVKADDTGKDESRRSRRKQTIFGLKQTILVKADDLEGSKQTILS